MRDHDHDLCLFHLMIELSLGSGGPVFFSTDQNKWWKNLIALYSEQTLCVCLNNDFWTGVQPFYVNKMFVTYQTR